MSSNKTIKKTRSTTTSVTKKRGRPRKQAKENRPNPNTMETACLASVKQFKKDCDHILKPVTDALVKSENDASVTTGSGDCSGTTGTSEQQASKVNEQQPAAETSADPLVSTVAKKSKSAVRTRRTYKKNTTPPKNHLITEYFSVLSRKRKTSKDLKEEQDREIIYHLENDIDPISILGIHEFEGKGRGIVALKPISKGSFVCEYRGDLIQLSDAKLREAEYEEQNKGCYMYYFAWNNRQWCIDATEDTGRYGRLINHSRKTPNCKSRLFIWNDLPRLIFYALTDIGEGCELLYDYGDTRRVAIDAHPWLKES